MKFDEGHWKHVWGSYTFCFCLTHLHHHPFFSVFPPQLKFTYISLGGWIRVFSEELGSSDLGLPGVVQFQHWKSLVLGNPSAWEAGMVGLCRRTFNPIPPACHWIWNEPSRLSYYVFRSHMIQCKHTKVMHSFIHSFIHLCVCLFISLSGFSAQHHIWEIHPCFYMEL